MAKTSGAAVLALQRYLTRKYGNEAFETVLNRMTPALSEPLHGIIMPLKWYPTESFIRAIEMAQQTFTEGDFYDAYGTAAANFEITAFQRFLLRFTSPAFLVERAGNLWHRFHDTGVWEMNASGKRFRGTLRDFGVVSSGYCRVLVAWFRRAGQLTGS